MQVELNGLPVFIDTGGREFFPGCPTLVFIHGAQHDHFVWKSLVTRLAGPGRNILAPDLPGHGRSGGPPLASIEAMAAWLVALLEKLGADRTARISLAGHSMGSLVALEAAARLPERVSHLVMIGTALPMPVSPVLLDAARADEAQAMALINRWSHSATAWRGGTRGSHGIWLPAMNLRIMERQPAGTLFNDLAACNGYRYGVETAARIDCPITLVAGTADRMTSVKSARKLRARLSNASLVEIAGAGHALMAEAPEAMSHTLRDRLPAQHGHTQQQLFESRFYGYAIWREGCQPNWRSISTNCRGLKGLTI
jgi:pimeloyl-ACP methyl ester carboxylesterase